jgi:hypothetical protein
MHSRNDLTEKCAFAKFHSTRASAPFAWDGGDRRDLRSDPDLKPRAAEKALEPQPIQIQCATEADAGATGMCDL